jgi:hypothetical protein
MTVKELINELSKFDENLPVGFKSTIEDWDEYGYSSNKEIVFDVVFIAKHEVYNKKIKKQEIVGLFLDGNETF